jgi:hypothetical protein
VNAARWPFLPPIISESVMALWPIVRDILLVAVGLVIIIKEALFTAHPSAEALITGLALTGIGASFHVGALVSGHIGGPSSDSSSPPGSSQSGPSPEGEDE